MRPVLKHYGFGWITFGFFVVTLFGHWLFGWFAYVSEQHAHAQAISVTDYLVEMTRDTLENWQSEFLQLLWQVAGLAMLLYVGSPQSKEGDDRMEAKLDYILQVVDPRHADKVLKEIDDHFAGRHIDSRYVAMLHAESRRGPA